MYRYLSNFVCLLFLLAVCIPWRLVVPAFAVCSFVVVRAGPPSILQVMHVV